MEEHSFLTLGTRWRSVVLFYNPVPLSMRKEPSTPSTGEESVGRPYPNLNLVKKKSLPPREVKK
jgi:hypothetical protein